MVCQSTSDDDDVCRPEDFINTTHLADCPGPEAPALWNGLHIPLSILEQSVDRYIENAH
jgi:hypothetical protein